jgi:NAD(P)-dependent dehydrogenase (short-subunit alcohol dehydrogenase family)
MQDFEGKVAVITGGASGIGFAMAERFAQEGMRVILADVEEPALEAAVTQLRQGEHEVLGVVTDVSKLESVQQLAARVFDEYGAVHVLCNNAGVAGPGGSSGPVWEKSDRDWQWAFGVNYWGVLHGIRAFVPRMIESGEEGHVVNTASVAGVTSNLFGIYGVTKHAVVALSEYLYRSLIEADAKVGASCLCPSFVASNLGTSDRNRPAELKNEAVTSNDAPPPWRDDPTIAAGIEARIDAAQAAGIVFEAVREGRFWIFTDHTMDEAMRARADGMVARRNPGWNLL